MAAGAVAAPTAATANNAMVTRRKRVTAAG
jgi:hypothetical protein